MVLPSGLKTTVKQIWTYDGPLEEAFCPQSVTLCLEHDIDVSRGDMIIGPDNLPGRSADLQAHVCWMHPRPLQAGRKYLLKHTTQTVQAVVTQAGQPHRHDHASNRSRDPAELAASTTSATSA